MKKVLFCLSLIFGLLVLNLVPSFGMEFTISPESIGGLGDLGYGLLGGATFDFNGTEYVVDDWDNLSEVIKEQKAQEQARKFLQAYCIQRGIPIPNIDPGLPASDPKAFYKSQYFNSANRTIWNNYKLGSTTIEQQDALRFPISPQAFSDWTEYNTFWYKKYIEQFTIGDENPDVPDSNIPDGYEWIEPVGSFLIGSERIDINETPLNAQPISWGASPINNIKDFDYYSFYSPSGQFNSSLTSGFGFYTLDLFDVNIYEDGQYWVVDFSDMGSTYTPNTYYYIPAYDMYTNYNSTWKYGDNYIYGWSTWAQSNYTGSSQPITGFDTALNWVFTHFRHINLYVENVLWISAGGSIDPAPANPTIPEFPDVIGGTAEDPIPAYDVILPDTTDQYGTFDITSLFDAIKEAIIGASDSDQSTSGTLTGEALKDTFKDRAGEAVGELTDTIDAILDDSFPLENTSNYPNLPPIPDAPISDAFAGTTILSQLIDACQQILPEPLTLAFWGMIFILFIIGLIRILHK